MPEINASLELWRQMLRIRMIELAIAEEYPKQEMRCPVHLSVGQEAVAVGVCAALKPSDVVYSNHRSHAHYLARGGSVDKLISELYGRSNGCSFGRGGSMHIYDREAGFYGATPIVSGTIPIAVGAAWAAKLKNQDHIVTVFIGDGSMEEGVVHEAMNFSALHGLPILFVCENNGYSVYTRLPARQPDRPLTELARAHTINAVSGDGNDVDFVSQSAQIAADNIRNGAGPQFMEFQTFRWLEHCGPYDDNDLGYRKPGELSAWKDKCPITRLQEKLAIDDRVVSDTENIISQEILDAFKLAQGSHADTFPGYSEYV